MASLCVIHEPENEYHGKARQNLSSHQLGDFRKCPELYHRKKSGLVPDVDSTAYLIGRAAHCLTLEGKQEFDRRYLVGGGPVNPKTGKPYGTATKAFALWKATEPRDVLTDTQYADICRMADSVRSHPTALTLLSAGDAEAVLRHPYCDVPCQIRMDWWRPGGLVDGTAADSPRIVDLKTCDDRDWFQADARRFGYVNQLAFYAAVVRAAANELPDVSIVAVEKKEPYRCGVWHLDRPGLVLAIRENEAAIAELKRCQRVGVWPTRYEQPRTLEYAA